MSPRYVHSFSGTGVAPSDLQAGLNSYDRDTIAYVAMQGAGDMIIRRIVSVMHERDALKIAAEKTAPDCPFDFAHTRNWCGHAGCRES